MSDPKPEPERIPALDLREQTDALWEELRDAVEGSLRSGRWIMGPNVDAFEREMAAFLGCRHALGIASGTDALTIGLRALGIGPGDEVLVPSFTFFATAEVVSLIGATPVFVDIDRQSFCMDPRAAERAITPRTRAIVPVHLYGHAADLDALLGLAEHHDLALLEDAAQAIGARCGERRLGTLGRLGAFSFYPTKNLGAAGDAGLLVTDDDALAEAVRALRIHGSLETYQHRTLGYAARLDDIQAAVLRVKLPRVDAWNAARRALAAGYEKRLGGTPGLRLPATAPGTEHAWHQYTVRIEGGRRDAVRDALAEAGVGSSIFYPVPIHRSEAYRAQTEDLDLGDLDLPETERAAAEVLSLPMWPELGEARLERVCAALRAALGGAG